VEEPCSPKGKSSPGNGPDGKRPLEKRVIKGRRGTVGSGDQSSLAGASKRREIRESKTWKIQGGKKDINIGLYINDVVSLLNEGCKFATARQGLGGVPKKRGCPAPGEKRGDKNNPLKGKSGKFGGETSGGTRKITLGIFTSVEKPRER